MKGKVGNVVRLIKQGRIIGGKTAFLLGMIRSGGPEEDSSVVQVWGKDGHTESQVYRDRDIQPATKEEADKFWDGMTPDIFIV